MPASLFAWTARNTRRSAVSLLDLQVVARWGVIRRGAASDFFVVAPCCAVLRGGLIGSDDTMRGNLRALYLFVRAARLARQTRSAWRLIRQNPRKTRSKNSAERGFLPRRALRVLRLKRAARDLRCALRAAAHVDAAPR